MAKGKDAEQEHPSFRAPTEAQVPLYTLTVDGQRCTQGPTCGSTTEVILLLYSL